ncbi:Hypothetical Protein FCC1311_055362 [Hondaea fermentalgiana]|uniref:Uncharacterized protein n=1 Tax=Hondaea fermentalgiana TaxID=2315210 RepID=A0A2R5GN70_9STRA|nr:Hypothetical Protein FCC1311_055362 [Hondaea fermentalgiana]|eukprot:GBG29314.1 Hypothetical Protein FCC1311_055362 [Hondaea fermentalgiana]
MARVKSVASAAGRVVLAVVAVLATTLAAQTQALEFDTSQAEVRVRYEDPAEEAAARSDPAKERRKLVVQQDFVKLNAALAGIQFGTNPGPCPSYSDSCYASAEDMPNWVKNTEVEISYLWLTFTRRIGDIVSDGDFWLYDLRCDNAQVDYVDLSLGALSRVSGEDVQRVNAGINDLKVNCFGRLRFEDMRLGIPVPIFGNFYFTVTGNTEVYLRKNEMSAEEGGIGASFAMNFFSPDFDYSPPTRFDFLDDESGCRFSISDGFSLENTSVGDIPSWIVQPVIDILMNTIQAILEQIMCNLARNSAYADDGSLGPGNEFIEEISNDVAGYKAAGLRGRTEFEQDESLNPGRLPNLEDPSTWASLRTNEIFEAISVGLNDYLGGESSETGYHNDLTINEVVSILTDGTGVYEIADLKEYFELDDYPMVEFGELITRNSLRLIGFRLTDINKFDNFQIFDNGFANPDQFGTPYEHTAVTNLRLANFRFDLTWDIEMRPGDWMQTSKTTLERFTFGTGIGFQGLEMEITSYQLFQQEKLFALQVGQLVGENFAGMDVLRCAFTTFDHFRVSGLQGSADVLEDFSVVNFFDLNALILDVMDVVNTLFKPTFANDFPYILENYVRPQLNDYLDNTVFVDAPPVCPSYVPLTYAGNDRFFNLTDTLAIDAVKNLVDNLIGGDPILRNSVDINALIQATLRYLVFDRPEGAINNDPDSAYIFENPSDGTWEAFPTILVSEQYGGDIFVIDVGPFRVTDLNSIWRFLLQPAPTDDYAMNFEFTWGDGTVNLQNGSVAQVGYLGFELPISLDASVSGQKWADEDFAIRLELQLEFSGVLGLEVLKNEVFQSEIGNLLTLQCLLAVLESHSLDQFEINVNDYTYGFVFPNGPQEFTAYRIGAAFEAWNQKLQTNEYQDTIEYFLNYVIDRVQNETIKLFNTEFDPPYTRSECLTQTDPLNGTIFASALPLPSLGDISDFLRQGTTEQPNPRGDDPASWERPVVNNEPVYDLTGENNAYIAALSASITAESLQLTLQDLARTVADPRYPSILDPLYKVFELEADNSTTLRLDMSSYNYEPDTEGLIPGFNFKLKDIVVRNVDRLTNVDVLKPYTSDEGDEAKFTTQHTFEWGDNLIELNFGFELETAAIVFNASAGPDDVLHDDVDVVLQLGNVSLEALFAAAVNQTDLSLVQMGEIIYFNETTNSFGIRADAFNCTIKRLMYEGGFFVPQFQAYVPDVYGPDITTNGSFLSQEARDVVELLVELLVAVFRKQVPNFTQGPVRDLINAELDLIVSEAKLKEDCTGVEYPDYNVTGRFMNFSASTFPPRMKELIQVDLLNPVSSININKMLDRYVNEVKVGVFDLFNATELYYNGLSLGLATWYVGDFQFEGLGTGAEGAAEVTKLRLFDTTDYTYRNPYTTTTAFTTRGALEVSFALTYEFDDLFVEKSGGGRRRRQLLEAPGAGGGGGNDVSVSSSASFFEEEQEHQDRSLVRGQSRALEETRFVKNELRMGMRLTNLDFGLDLLHRIDIQQFLDLRLGNLLDLYYKPSNVPCLLSIFDEEGLRIQDFNFTAEQVRLTARCEGECTSPMLEALQDAGAITDDRASADLTEGFNTIVQAVTALAGQSDAQEYVDLAIATARRECTGIEFTFDPLEKQELTDAASLMGYAGVGILGGAIAAGLFLMPLHARRRNQLMFLAFNRLQEKSNGDLSGKGEDLLLVERRLSSMFRHPLVSTVPKFAVPFFILVAVALFIAANIGTVGATVKLTMSIAGDTTQSLPILQFTLASSINDMWNAGTYPLALIIFVASGAWPHTKSVLLLVAWFTPPTLLSHKRRGSVLEVLDSLGKWSLIDAYVLVMLQVAFRFYITSTYVAQLDFLPDDVFIVDVIVEPGLSIYLFVIATMLALVVNQYMIAKHRSVIAQDEDLEDKLNDLNTEPITVAKQALHRHVFLVPDERNLLYGFSPGAKLAAGGLVCISGLLILVGSFLNLISFTYKGIAGAMIGVLQPELQRRSYTSVGIATAISEGVPSDDAVAQLAVAFLQIVYVLFTLVAPIVLCLLLLILLYVPLHEREQRTLLFSAEIVAAWEALLVLLVAIVAAALEVSQLAQFIVESGTGDACEYIVEPLLFIGLSEEDALCFDVVAVIEGTSAVLIGGIFMLLCTEFYVFRMIRAALNDRTWQIRNRLDKHGVCPKLVEGRWPSAFLLRNSVRPVSRIRAAQHNSFSSYPSVRDGQVAPAVFVDANDDDGYNEFRGIDEYDASLGSSFFSGNRSQSSEISSRNPSFVGGSGRNIDV